MFQNMADQLRWTSKKSIRASSDCARRCTRATERLIRREPTKALFVAAALGAAVELGLFALQRRRSRPVVPPPPRWRQLANRLHTPPWLARFLG